MGTMLVILDTVPIIGGAAAGGSGILGLVGYLIKRHLTKRDEREKRLHAKLDYIVDTTHRTNIDVAILSTQVTANIGRIDRMEASVDDVRRDVKVVKRRATDKLDQSDRD